MAHIHKEVQLFINNFAVKVPSTRMQKDFTPLSAQIPAIAHGPQREDRIIFLSSISSKALLETSLSQLKQLLTEANEYEDLRLKDLTKDLERQIRIKNISSIPKQYFVHEMSREQAEQLIEQCSLYDDQRMKVMTRILKSTINYISRKNQRQPSWWQTLSQAFHGEDLASKMERQRNFPEYKDDQKMRLNQKRYLPEFPSKKKNG